MPTSTRSFAPFVVAAAMLLLPAVYVASYFWLVEKDSSVFSSTSGAPAARYRYIDCAAVQSIYLPVHACDRQARKDYWTQVADFDVLIDLITTTVHPETSTGDNLSLSHVGGIEIVNGNDEEEEPSP